MIKIITPLFAVFAGVVSAQPTITVNDVTPELGPTPTQYALAAIPPGPATANFSFNPGPITLGEGVQSNYVLPSSTPYASLFPTATHASTGLTNPDTYSYQQINATGLSLIGIAGSAYTAIYSNPDRFLALPMSYNTTWTDNWVVDFDFGSTQTTRTGVTTGHYNGYGTIVLPWGTFTNVARIEILQEFSDALNGTVFAEGSVSTVTYYMPGFEAALFTTTTVITLGQETSSTTVSFPSSVGMLEGAAQDLGFMLFPNPANETSTIRLVNTNDAVTIEVIDMLGRTAAQQQVAAHSATQDITLDLHDLAPGHYHVVLRTANGRMGSMPLVRQ